MEPGEITIEHSCYSMELFIRGWYLSKELKHADKNGITTLPLQEQSII